MDLQQQKILDVIANRYICEESEKNMEHILKLQPKYFDFIKNGTKRIEWENSIHLKSKNNMA